MPPPHMLSPPPVLVRVVVPVKFEVAIEVKSLALILPVVTVLPLILAFPVTTSVNEARFNVLTFTVKLVMVTLLGSAGMFGAALLVMFTVLAGAGGPTGVQLPGVFQLELAEPFQVYV